MIKGILSGLNNKINILQFKRKKCVKRILNIFRFFVISKIGREGVNITKLLNKKCHN